MRRDSESIGITPVDPERDKSDAESFPAHAPSRGVAARATADTNTASAAHSRLRHVAACDQCVLASSSEKSTPPTGAPNAAARPAATPALRKSRPSASLWNASSRQPPCAKTVICRVHRLATPAPTCTSGPSGPAGAPDATASAAPTAFTATASKPSRSGTCTPFRLAITSATPAPAAAGATNTTSAEAAAASAEPETTAAASAEAAAVVVSGASGATARAAREMKVNRARTSTVIECSMANARSPVTVPMTRVMTHFLTFAVCRPARRKLRARVRREKREFRCEFSFSSNRRFRCRLVLTVKEGECMFRVGCSETRSRAVRPGGFGDGVSRRYHLLSMTS